MEEKTLTIVKERRFGHDDWYELRVDDQLVFGSHTLQKVTDLYNQIKENKDVAVVTREILVSEKI